MNEEALMLLPSGSFQFVGLECLMTSLVDLFPTYLRKGFRRELLLLVICSTSCLLGLSLVTEVCTVALHAGQLAKLSSVLSAILFMWCLKIQVEYCKKQRRECSERGLKATLNHKVNPENMERLFSVMMSVLIVMPYWCFIIMTMWSGLFIVIRVWLGSGFFFSANNDLKKLNSHVKYSMKKTGLHFVKVLRPMYRFCRISFLRICFKKLNYYWYWLLKLLPGL